MLRRWSINLLSARKSYILMLLTFVMIFQLGVFNSAIAKQFANEYTEFELPAGWDCSLQGSDWICQSTNKDRQREAMIIIVAKIRNDFDSLDKYLLHLKEAKEYQIPGGKSQLSEVKYAKFKTIKNHKWVDSLHFASEIPGFYTRYLATVKADLGLAVSFTVFKDYYSAYSPIFDRVIDTLQVFRAKEGAQTQFKLKPQEKDLLDNNVVIPDSNGDVVAMPGQKQKQGKKKAAGQKDLIFYLALGALAVGGLIIIKRKKK